MCGAPALLLAATTSRAAAGPVRRAAVIGSTGRGNYGHGMDRVFRDRPGIEVVALADPNPAGADKARAAAGARRVYGDYREMLERERPELVSVAPRWSEEHHPMVRAALEAGAHVYCEKPFTRTLAEADDLLAVARAAGRRIAVAHQGRLSPATLALKARLEAGEFGELREIRINGKQDRRAGGEDLLVLGTHQFDLVRLFAGDPLWCTARILQGAREVTLGDARAATEGVGPVLGDAIDAFLALPRGVAVHYTSRARGAAAAGPWGMELICSRGRVRLLNDPITQVFVSREEKGGADGWRRREWEPLSPGLAGAEALRGGQDLANRRVVDDWLSAIAEGREPACSGFAAMKSLEIIHAILRAGLTRGRVALPLSDRAHPLAAA